MTHAGDENKENQAKDKDEEEEETGVWKERRQTKRREVFWTWMVKKGRREEWNTKWEM